MQPPCEWSSSLVWVRRVHQTESPHLVICSLWLQEKPSHLYFVLKPHFTPMTFLLPGLGTSLFFSMDCSSLFIASVHSFYVIASAIFIKWLINVIGKMILLGLLFLYETPWSSSFVSASLSSNSKSLRHRLFQSLIEPPSYRLLLFFLGKHATISGTSSSPRLTSSVGSLPALHWNGRANISPSQVETGCSWKTTCLLTIQDQIPSSSCYTQWR